MAFKDEGQPRWETYDAGGSGDTAVTASTPSHLLVKGSRAVGAKYKKAALTSAATDTIDGVIDHVRSEETTDPYENIDIRQVRVKRSKKLRCRVDAAYAAANYGQSIAPSADSSQRGWGTFSATYNGTFVDGGETIDGVHYADFWKDESQ